MTDFDRSLRYQLALFYGSATDEQVQRAGELLPDLAEMISAQVQGVDNYALKFGTSRYEQVLVSVGDGSLVPMTKLSWSTPTNPWQLEWTSQRIDVHFDARGYADTREEEEVKTLASIRDRVLPNLIIAAERLGVPIVRTAAIVKGETSCSGQKAPAQIVADIFFNEDFRREASEQALLDVRARVNRVVKWQLDGVEYKESKISVNRIELGEAKWSLRPDGDDLSLFWQLDVNTSPQAAASAVFSDEGINGFFEKAVDWVEERLASLDEVAS